MFSFCGQTGIWDNIAINIETIKTRFIKCPNEKANRHFEGSNRQIGGSNRQIIVANRHFACLDKGKGVWNMRKKRQKGQCTKIQISKSEEICRCYDKLTKAYAYQLDGDDGIAEFSMNVLLDFDKYTAISKVPTLLEPYMTDFLVKRMDGSIAVRECVFRHVLSRKHVIDLLQISMDYWLQQGISDWGIVIDAAKDESL